MVFIIIYFRICQNLSQFYIFVKSLLFSIRLWGYNFLFLFIDTGCHKTKLYVDKRFLHRIRSSERNDRNAISYVIIIISKYIATCSQSIAAMSVNH